MSVNCKLSRLLPYRDQDLGSIQCAVISNLTIPPDGWAQEFLLEYDFLQHIAVECQKIGKAGCVLREVGQLAHRDGSVSAAKLLRVCRARL